ncbi:MAG: hypothetical protein ACREBD_38325 [Blastocatellia bacterium]
MLRLPEKVRQLNDRAYWLSMLWLGRHDEVLLAMEEWQERDSDIRPAYAALRVSAIRSALDGSSDQAYYDRQIPVMLSCLGESFRLDGYSPLVVHEGFRALGKLRTALVWNILTPTAILAGAQFLGEHLTDMCGTSNEYSMSDEFIRELVEVFCEAPVIGFDNPLKTDRWVDIIRYGDPGDDALEDAGYERAKITRLVVEHGHLFARSLDGSRDFYVRVSATDMTPVEFSHLRLGQNLMILPSSDPPNQGRAWPAKHAMIP